MVTDDFGRVLDDLGTETIKRFDLEESVDRECVDECFTFHAMPRQKQLAVLRTLDDNLVKTKRVNYRSPSSYALKHDLERCVNFYVSNLQCKTAMRILGYTRGGGTALNPQFNISMKSARAFHDLSLARVS